MFVKRLSIFGSGLTVGIKDNIDVIEVVSGMGCEAFEKAPKAAQSADVVEQLMDADFHLLGKLVMHELAFGMTGLNAFSGTPKNVLYPMFIPGGSSSGCATSVADGLVDVAIGTDTGGSIRLPAACCGVVGLKPTFGRLSRKGVSPKSSSLDCVGPLSRSVELIEKAMQAMDSSFFVQAPPTKIKLGILNAQLTKDNQGLFSQTLDTLASLSNVELFDISVPGMGDAHKAGLTLIASEAYTAFGHLPSSELGQDVANRLEAAASITDAQVQQAETIQQNFREQVSTALAKCDALLLATLPSPPLFLRESLRGEVDLDASTLVRPFNVSGHPAITLPVASDTPFGIQLVGALDEDEKLCAIARFIEAHLDAPTYPN